VITGVRFLISSVALAVLGTMASQVWAGEDFCPLDCATGSLNTQPSIEEATQDGVQVHVNERFYGKPDRQFAPGQQDSPSLHPVLPTLVPERLDGQTAPTATSSGPSAGSSAGGKSSSPGIQPRQPRGPRQGRQSRIKFSPRA
jgi:hypothetical protein